MEHTTEDTLRVSYAQAVHDDKEKERVIKVLDEHRTILGREVLEFEERVAKEFGKKYGVMVNSGSSANLLAIELLNLPAGSEVITPLLTFSTTVTPLLQKGLVPVFIDVEPGTYISRIDQIEKLITKKTKALMMPLLLGNVPDMKRLKELADTYNLFIVEDSCDTLGARFEDKPTGMFSDISTTSFYGSHIITAGGGGGMLMLNREDWRDRAKVLRGWGRSSSVLKDHEKIEDRFNVKLDNITYDANFIFDERGYNFLPMEIGAAFGNAQLDKLPQFRKTRQANFENLLTFFKQYESFFILPQQSEKIDTQWLAFPLTIKKTAPFTRLQIATHLEKNNIQTRTVFTGNILKQPAFKDMPHIALSEGYPATDEIMERGFLIGCHHGMEEKHLQKIKNVITSFITANT